MSGPKLPGMPRRRYVDKGDRHTPYDREALRRKILDALQHGPMEKWKLREAVHDVETRILTELMLLRRLGAIKRLGPVRRAQWALATYEPPKATLKQRAFNDTPIGNANTVLVARRKAPKTSWWADAKTREEFNEKLAKRAGEIADIHGPVPDYGRE
jgi:hypothetical protein